MAHLLSLMASNGGSEPSFHVKHVHVPAAGKQGMLEVLRRIRFVVQEAEQERSVVSWMHSNCHLIAQVWELRGAGVLRRAAS